MIISYFVKSQVHLTVIILSLRLCNEAMMIISYLVKSQVHLTVFILSLRLCREAMLIIGYFVKSQVHLTIFILSLRLCREAILIIIYVIKHQVQLRFCCKGIILNHFVNPQVQLAALVLYLISFRDHRTPFRVGDGVIPIVKSSFFEPQICHSLCYFETTFYFRFRNEAMMIISYFVKSQVHQTVFILNLRLCCEAVVIIGYFVKSQVQLTFVGSCLRLCREAIVISNFLMPQI